MAHPICSQLRHLTRFEEPLHLLSNLILAHQPLSPGILDHPDSIPIPLDDGGLVEEPHILISSLIHYTLDFYLQRIFCCLRKEWLEESKPQRSTSSPSTIPILMLLKLNNGSLNHLKSLENISNLGPVPPHLTSPC